jgi:hypothetical protein
MDLQILRIFGQVAGLAGLSLGVLLILFRDIIRKTIFSGLTQEHGYRLLRLIVILVWSLAVLGIGTWVYSNKQESSRQTKTESTPEPKPDPGPPKQFVNETAEYPMGEVPSGAHADYSPWYSLCSDNEPADWKIVDSTFTLTGDRSCTSGWAECKKTTDTETKVCFQFRMQGHSEQNSHGDTGIQYSRGHLKVVWKHPKTN